MQFEPFPSSSLLFHHVQLLCRGCIIILFAKEGYRICTNNPLFIAAHSGIMWTFRCISKTNKNVSKRHCFTNEFPFSLFFSLQKHGLILDFNALKLGWQRCYLRCLLDGSNVQNYCTRCRCGNQQIWQIGISFTFEFFQIIHYLANCIVTALSKLKWHASPSTSSAFCFCHWLIFNRKNVVHIY